MLYKVEYGMYDGHKKKLYFSSLSIPDIDLLYSQVKKREFVNYLKLNEYLPVLKKWDFIYSMFR